MIGLALAATGLAAIDCAVSLARMRRYGPMVELNPVAAKLASKFGPIAGIVALGVQNALVIGGLAKLGSNDLMAMLVGAKLGLLAMQLKSYHLESMVRAKLLEILPKAKKNG